jgi:hypothetical protein
VTLVAGPKTQKRGQVVAARWFFGNFFRKIKHLQIRLFKSATYKEKSCDFMNNGFPATGILLWADE